MTVWSGPAWTEGGWLVSVTVTVTWSVAVALYGSITVRVSMISTVELTCGAVKVADSEVISSRITSGAVWLWAHR